MPSIQKQDVKIRSAVFPDDQDTVGALFLAYAHSLPISLDFQNFQHELSGLPGKYAEDVGGGVWLAFSTCTTASNTEASSVTTTTTTTSEIPIEFQLDSKPISKPIGCIALRPFHPPTSTPISTSLSATSSVPDTQTCELKRLYLTPESRGLGVSKMLLDVVLNRARELGYREILLDTLITMTTARKLYEGYGFEEIGSYYESVEGAVFYRLGL